MPDEGRKKRWSSCDQTESDKAFVFPGSKIWFLKNDFPLDFSIIFFFNGSLGGSTGGRVVFIVVIALIILRENSIKFSLFFYFKQICKFNFLPAFIWRNKNCVTGVLWNKREVLWCICSHFPRLLTPHTFFFFFFLWIMAIAPLSRRWKMSNRKIHSLKSCSLQTRVNEIWGNKI